MYPGDEDTLARKIPVKPVGSLLKGLLKELYEHAFELEKTLQFLLGRNVRYGVTDAALV